MKTILFKKLVLAVLFFLPFFVIAQTISGSVKDENGELLPFVNVIEQGTSNGTSTDEDGNFTLRVSLLPTVLEVSSLGYNETTMEVTSTGNVEITLKEEGLGLDEIVLTGNRAKPRTILDSPVPVDNINAAELVASGKITVEEMLTYKVPSFNSSNQTISDATAHFDPADLRGLGPSRTLVLINGKRKNQSSLVYINDTPGKGEVGTDLKSIPAAAIERIEVLRDGASAQYGSDAIAGVINIILKKNVKYVTANVNSGITIEGDGLEVGADINGAVLNENGGYVNYTVGLKHQQHTNRAGEPGGDALFGVPENDPTWGSWLADNPDLGMTVGQPDMNTGEVMLNAGMPFKNGKGEFYATMGVTLRRGNSFALYRTPYWVGDPHNLLHNASDTYTGFQPTFKTNIVDNFDILGAKFDAGKFKVDVSGTFGVNTVDYTIGNTLNPDMAAQSPTSFEAGGYNYSNLIGNVDVSRSFDKVSVIFGAEYKKENFKASEGEPASYFGGGAQSFPGLQPSNRVDADRGSFGAYANVDFDVTDALLFGGAARFENYDDFGANTSFKVNGRYKIGSKATVRSSFSTGFRAPSLHQIYLSNVQTLVSGNTISNQGTFNNVDPVIRTGLGVPQLKAETSTNITAGVTAKLNRKVSISVDYYKVNIDDRVLFTGEIGFDNVAGDNPVETILTANNITSLKFFTNAINTETQGVDIVANYDNIRFPKGKLGFNFALNWNETMIVDQIKTPQLLADNGYEIFNRKEASRIESSRPKIKGLLGIKYEQDKFHLIVNNTLFGPVKWRHASDPSKDQTFSGKTLTDVVFGYDIYKWMKFNLVVNNAFNVYPDEIDTKGDPVTDLGGRFRYPWEVNQFGFLGTKIKAGFTFNF
ncbi:MAG: TonB-dependent receptor [Flavobacteriaceae bacterium]